MVFVVVVCGKNLLVKLSGKFSVLYVYFAWHLLYDPIMLFEENERITINDDVLETLTHTEK